MKKIFYTETEFSSVPILMGDKISPRIDVSEEDFHKVFDPKLVKTLNKRTKKFSFEKAPEAQKPEIDLKKEELRKKFQDGSATDTDIKEALKMIF